jgi:hypothetical protein
MKEEEKIKLGRCKCSENLQYFGIVILYCPKHKTLEIQNISEI